MKIICHVSRAVIGGCHSKVKTKQRGWPPGVRAPRLPCLWALFYVLNSANNQTNMLLLWLLLIPLEPLLDEGEHC